MHNGKAVAGIASPTFRHGRYSKAIPARLLDAYHNAVTDTELLSLRDDIGLVDALLTDALGRLDPDKPVKVEALLELQSLIEQRRKLVESEQKRLIAMQSVITSEQAMTLIAAVQASIRQRALDLLSPEDAKALLRAVAADMQGLVNR